MKLTPPSELDDSKRTALRNKVKQYVRSVEDGSLWQLQEDLRTVVATSKLTEEDWVVATRPGSTFAVAGLKARNFAERIRWAKNYTCPLAKADIGRFWLKPATNTSEAASILPAAAYQLKAWTIDGRSIEAIMAFCIEANIDLMALPVLMCSKPHSIFIAHMSTDKVPAGVAKRMHVSALLRFLAMCDRASLASALAGVARAVAAGAAGFPAYKENIFASELVIPTMTVELADFFTAAVITYLCSGNRNHGGSAATRALFAETGGHAKDFDAWVTKLANGEHKEPMA
jgi:hypothetical protein